MRDLLGEHLLDLSPCCIKYCVNRKACLGSGEAREKKSPPSQPRDNSLQQSEQKSHPLRLTGISEKSNRSWLLITSFTVAQ